MQYLLEAVSWRWFLVKLVRKLSQNSQGSTCAEDLFMVKGKVAVQHLTCRFAQLLNQLGPRASTIKKVWSIFYALFRSNWKNVFKACKSEKKTTIYVILSYIEIGWITMVTLTCSIFMKFETRIQREIINLVIFNLGNIFRLSVVLCRFVK